MSRERKSIASWAGILAFFLLIFVPSTWFFAETLVGALVEAAKSGKSPLLSIRTLRLLGRSGALGAGAALLALALGTTTGWATTRLGFPGRKAFFALLLLAFLIPPYSYASAWVELLAASPLPTDGTARPSPVYSLGAAAAVLSLHLFPWAHLAAAVGFASIERHTEEAARLTLPAWTRFRRVSLPLVGGILAAVGLFVFVLGLKNHSVAMLLRQRVLATEILVAYEALADDRGAALTGFVFVAVALVALGLSIFAAKRRRRIAVEGLSAPWEAATFDSPLAARLLAGAAVVAIFAAAVILPLAVLLKTAGGWSNYTTVWRSAWPQVVNGVATAAATATTCTVLGFLVAEFILGVRLGAGALIAAAVFLLFALPAPVLDLGLIRFWNRPGLLGRVYDSGAMLVLGQTAEYLPVAVIGFAVALLRLDKEPIEAARLGGLSETAILFRIRAPLLRPWFLVIWAIVFVLAIEDVEAAVLLAPAGRATLAVRIMTLLHYAPDAQVSALCIIQVIVAALVLALVAGLGAAWKTISDRKKARGTGK